MPPGIVAVAYQQVPLPAVDAGDVPLQVLPVDVQNTADSKGHRGAGGIVIIPDLAAAIGFKDHLAPLQHIAGGNAVYRLRGADPVGIVGEADGIRSVVRRGQLPTLLPGEGITVMVLQRIAYSIVADGSGVVSVYLLHYIL